MSLGTSIAILLLTGILALIIGLTVMWLAIFDRAAIHDLFWVCVAYAISVAVCAPLTAWLLKETNHPVHVAWGALSVIGVIILFARLNARREVERAEAEISTRDQTDEEAS